MQLENEQENFVNNNDNNANNKIDCVLPPAEISICFSINGLRTKKPCFLYAEKLDYKGIIQLRLTEKADQRKMYITTIDTAAFAELKQEQSLHVTFLGFIENLVRILQDCIAGKLEINLIQQTNSFGACGGGGGGEALADFSEVSSAGYQLQFVELRPFKNLIHLCLPCRKAPLNIVLFYINNNLDVLQKKLASQDQNAQQLQHEVHAHLRRIEQLESENSKLRNDVLENARNLSQRHIEEMQQMQESLRKSTEQRHNDNERSRKTISSLQSQIEKLGDEKASLQNEKCQEHKRVEALSEEIKNLKTHVNYVKDQNEKLQIENLAVRNSEKETEAQLISARKRIDELEETLSKFEKTKADIIAELEAEKKILHTKRKALEMTTEEISKANEIIFKQSQELHKLKKTISWRTEVALEQEKAIKEKEIRLEVCEKEVKVLKQTIASLREEIPLKLETMRQLANDLEKKYQHQIAALREEVSGQDNTKVVFTRNRNKHHDTNLLL